MNIVKFGDRYPVRTIGGAVHVHLECRVRGVRMFDDADEVADCLAGAESR